MTNYPKVLLISLLGLFCLQQADANDERQLSEGADHDLSIQTNSPIRENQLLLPKSYHQHRPLLWKAAALAIQTSRCARFLFGDLQRDYSTLTHPVFRIQCRDRENRSYALLVDGLSMRVLDDTHPAGSISFADLEQEFEAGHERDLVWSERITTERLAAAKDGNDAVLLRELENLKSLENARHKLLWEHCLRQLKMKVRNMNKLTWLTQDMPRPEIEENNRLIYYIDFDAQDLYQQPLHYRAECSIADIGDLRLQIRPRKNIGPDSIEENQKLF